LVGGRRPTAGKIVQATRVRRPNLKKRNTTSDRHTGSIDSTVGWRVPVPDDVVRTGVCAALDPLVPDYVAIRGVLVAFV
jgi:hypothetical protein